MLRRSLYFFVGIILILLIPTSISSRLRSTILHTLSPVTKPLITANRSLSATWKNLSQIPELQQQRASLQTQVVSLQTQFLKTEQLETENTALRKEIGVTGVTQTIPKLLAHVLIQGSDPLDQTVTVDVGTTQGVAIDQPAVYQGILIGRVIEVEPTTSIVRLITSNHSLIQAEISSSQSKGILMGTGTGVVLTDIEQGVSTSNGDTVSTSGLGGSLPADILIGQLGSRTSEASSPSQSFQVTLPYPPSTFSTFFILLRTSSS